MNKQGRKNQIKWNKRLNNQLTINLERNKLHKLMKQKMSKMLNRMNN